MPPSVWAIRELGRIDSAAGLQAADRLAAILREFIERRDGLPAPHLTTTELLAECAMANWPQELTDPLRELLDRCDRAKFAGDVPYAAEMESLRARTVAWIAPPQISGGNDIDAASHSDPLPVGERVVCERSEQTG